MRWIILLLIATFATVEVANADTVTERYARLSCAIVYLRTGQESGTGFFIDKEGRIATAAHVALNRYSSLSHKDYSAEIKNGLNGITPEGETIVIPKKSLSTLQLSDSRKDIAIIETGHPTDCFIPLATSVMPKVGDHMIAIGYPSTVTANMKPAITLFDGLVSGKYSSLHDIAVVKELPGASHLNEKFDVLRLQMPITPGASGSPIIDDKDNVVAILIEEPSTETKEINDIIEQQLKSSPVGHIEMLGIDLSKTLAEYIYLSQQYVSSGTGLAVPISYLSNRH